MKEAHGDPRPYASGGHEGADVALTSPLVAVAGTNVGGANQAGVRLYNERLLLSLVRTNWRNRRAKAQKPAAMPSPA